MKPISGSASELSVLSLNVWGLKYVSKDRSPRIQAIAAYLASSKHDVVCLQEVWIYSDYELVKREVQRNLPYSRFFHTGALGSGLAIFTRFPIISAQAHPYSLSGLPLDVIAGDFFVNKAAGSVVFLHPDIGEVEVWTTHMYAGVSSNRQTTRAHLISQAWQLANAIRASAERGRYVLVAGDFNCLPSSMPVAILRDHASVLDSWLVTHPQSQSVTCSEPATAQEAIDILGMTCDSPLNSYSAGKKLHDVAKQWKGKRLDYIFYRGPEVARRRPLKWTFKPETAMGGTGTTVNDAGPSADHLEEGQPIMSSLDSAPVLTCTSSKIVLTERVPGHNFSYSDHFGVASTFQILPPKQAQGAPNGSKYLADEETTQHRPLPSHYDPSGPLINIDESTSLQPPQENSTTLSTSPFPTQPSKTATMRSALDILHGYIRSVRKTSNRQLCYFGTSVVFAIALTVSSAWQPKSWIQPIWTLLGIGAGAMGATMLYVGFVWGQWESNLLREVIEEMELEQKVVEMETSAGAVQPETM